MQQFTLERKDTVIGPTGERYPIDKLLGSGTFGKVFSSGADKIIKIMKTSSHANEKNLKDEVTIQRLLSEKEPDICPKLYAFGYIEVTREYVIVMEKCEDTVRNLLKRDPSPENFLDYYEQVATIMQRLEKYEFNHRDLKSDNVMYKTDPTTGKRKFLLIDFGFSCITVDGKKYSTSVFMGGVSKCFRRSRDLAQMVFESLYYTTGNMRTFAQLILTFKINGIKCDMSKGCKPYFDGSWQKSYEFLNKDIVENPNTTPEGLLKAVAAFRQGGLKACKAGFVVNPATDMCEPVPGEPAPAALKVAVTPVPKPAKEKECPPGKVLNPKTRRCVKEKAKADGAKSCPPGKVLNPKTRRCVKEKVKGPKTCPPGKVLNPVTGRCNKVK